MSSCANPTSRHTLADVIAAHAQAQPDAPAFIVEDTVMSWRQYHHRAELLAAVLIARDFAKGERIGVLLPDGAEVHVVFVACEKAGLIGVGIPARAAEQEITHLLRVSGASALLSAARHGDEDTASLYTRLQRAGLPLRAHIVLHDTPERPGAIAIDGAAAQPVITPALAELIAQRHVQPHEIFLLNSTSGTTGMPKCVMQHQARWFHWAELAQDSAPLSRADVFLCAVPAAVGFGLWSGHFIPTLLGAPTVLLPKFNTVQLLQAIQRHRVSVLAAVSTQFIMLLNTPELQGQKLDSLRILYTGGEMVPYQRAAHFEELTGATVLQFYGSNESGALSYTTVRDGRERRLTTAGRICEHAQIRLIDAHGTDVTATGHGQPVCRGPSRTLGYYNNPEANRELYTDDGAMKVGDVVSIDAEGYLKVVGRVGDFIIRGGKNISAAAVEQALLTHPSIRMAAVVAMPDPVFGEKVCAYVTVAPHTVLSVGTLAEFLRAGGISKEWFPERLEILPELPQVSGGKVAKQVLREKICRQLEAEARNTKTAQ